MTIGRPDEMAWGRRVGAACCPEKVGSSGCNLHGSLEELLQVELGHTGRGVGRRPCASLQRAVRTSFLRTVKVGLKQRFRHQNPQLRHAAPDSIRLTVPKKILRTKIYLLWDEQLCVRKDLGSCLPNLSRF